MRKHDNLLRISPSGLYNCIKDIQIQLKLMSINGVCGKLFSGRLRFDWENSF